ncbi:MAG: oxygen-independent coproporphyrinogen III oxidase [Acidobacteria bacterium]|nr:oxygen-independent coproporphyrinogen III oxidase [Acidobacteriota bacterium]NIM63314.1 oxygen-independent coproporphyrinogen III oxidase [Acidobacteriota bacterium]NIO60498.1 oxygen-independent coproporphyrinogen III oxidase [Acidobacteriota bacterium]NIQ31618.1 oxygen-independent coproporphyrinogen III oxidase [Acidobacteriota bacterium]NIQ87105.1 oxygen-independent coproporphyrinogen III oxidase [Acidobacteriota bacterium]
MKAPPILTGFGNGDVEVVEDRWLDEAARTVPRYTSYPTAHAFVPGFTSEVYADWLARIEGPIALYVHIPFCIERCAYCACNVIATKHRDAASAYLKLLGREVLAVSERLKKKVCVTRMHWGGGTPTYYTPAELRLAVQAIRGSFEFTEDAEISIEADPRVTTIEHLRMLRRLKFNRLSIGVQDFAPAVQAMIGRIQSAETTRRVVRNARALGFDSVNLDLVYGLPLQTERRIAQTMEPVVEMRPDRIAIYGYAHLPERVPNQRKIDPATVPGVRLRRRLEEVARKRLVEAGYVEVGLDHFALPTDPLAKAAKQRSVHRDFMGYTTSRDSTLVAVGVSSISELPQGLIQNVKKLSAYERALDRGELPVEKGCRTNADDLIRRHVIQRLMCDLEVRYEEVERAHAIRFEEYFKEELRELRVPDGLIAREIARETPVGLTVEPAARSLVRNVCYVFDRRARQSGDPPAGMSSAG